MGYLVSSKMADTTNEKKDDNRLNFEYISSASWESDDEVVFIEENKIIETISLSDEEEEQGDIELLSDPKKNITGNNKNDANNDELTEIDVPTIRVPQDDSFESEDVETSESVPVTEEPKTLLSLLATKPNEDPKETICFWLMFISLPFISWLMAGPD